MARELSLTRALLGSNFNIKMHTNRRKDDKDEYYMVNEILLVISSQKMRDKTVFWGN